jgi:hypothetical protein
MEIMNTRLPQSQLRPLAPAAALFGCILAFAVSSASASVVWDLNPNHQNGAVGSSSLTLTSQGYQITARGYDNVSGPDTSHELYFKQAGPVGGASESGLGLVGTIDNELQVTNGTPDNYIQLDLRQILSQGFTNGAISVGSVQQGEQFSIYGSASQGQLGTLLGTYGSTFDNQFVNITNFGQYAYISVGAANDDVLPVAFRADITPVPEMNSLFPIVGLATAIGTTHMLRRRQLRKRNVAG